MQDSKRDPAYFFMKNAQMARFTLMIKISGYAL